MNYAEHEKLIKDLETKVKEGSPSTGFAEPYFKRCWALIKKIGPSFKETNYPNRVERDARWNRFQAAVDIIKRQQKLWEDASAKTQLELLALIEKARPSMLSMADLIGSAQESQNAPDGDSSKEESDAVPLSRRAQLEACSSASDLAFVAFMEAKTRLSHTHYKVVSEKLREIRQLIQKAWTEFKEGKQERAEERKNEWEAKSALWRKKQEWYLSKLKDSLDNDVACLANKTAAIASFQKILSDTQDAAEVKRTQTWITENQDIVAELEKSIEGLKARIAEVEKQLAPEKPV